MSRGRGAVAGLLVPLAVLLAGPAPASCPGGTLRWRGTVDDELVLAVRGDRAWSREGAGGEQVRERVSASAPLPEEEALVYGRVLGGRVLVSVDQQPEAGNDFTASVTLYNPYRGPEEVEVELVWLRAAPTAGGGRGSVFGGSPPGGGFGGGHRPPDQPDEPLTGPSGRPLDRLLWSGVVDGSDRIDLRGDRITVHHEEHLPIQAMDWRVTAPLPEREVEVDLVVRRGRGRVRLIAAPEAANDYTASVRIDDRDHRGADEYAFELVWERPRGVRIGGGGRALETLTWSGRVDASCVLVVQGDQVRIEPVSGQPARQREARFTAPLPARPVSVNLVKLEGRGKARIEAQPSADNGHTLRVRVDDDKGGADDYRLELSWEK